MGVSAQAHRICVGMFAGGRSPAPPWTARGQYRPGWGEIFQIMIYILLMMGSILHAIQEPQAAVSSILLQSVSGWDVYDGCCGDFVLQIQMLLIMAGDVELNPGPLTPEELTQGLATLIIQAPEIVKPVLGVWSPEKGDMVTEWNSNKFTVPVLREAMAWLQNTSVDEVSKQLKRKLDLAMAMAVEIERLLPDECGSCQARYTVGRVDKPTLQCAGCHQGIHEECLQELLGEATATLSTLHGTLTWLCQACAPNYRMMTVVVPGGTQRPVNRRLATRQAAAPPAQNSAAPSSESVDEISDRLAAISVSNSESITITPPSQTNQQLPGQQVEEGQVQAGAVSDSHQGTVPLGEDCPLFLKGECPFGISGRKGGLCTAVHRKRCNKFLRWGTKSEKGCKEQACPNLHPSVCPASLDLLCVNQGCEYKLHIQRCKRKVSSEASRAAKQSRDRAGTASSRQHSRGAGAGQGKGQGGGGGPKHPSPGRTQDRSGCTKCGSNPGESGTARSATKAGVSDGNQSQSKTGNKSDCQSNCCCAAATNSSCCASDSSTSRDSESSVTDKCCASHHRGGGQSHVDPAGGILPPAEGFQLPTVQPLLEAWMESARKDMMQKQQELMLHMLMMQARPPMLGRGAYGLLPSL